MNKTVDRPRRQLPCITDQDISEVAERSKLQLDAERREILACMQSVDVRACPGSGKTTLLVAKLAILSAKWKSKNQGICVLSHTNVAKCEIQRRFVEHPALQQLNSYPHFVGTIQAFVDRFLGTAGALLAFGRRPHFIDNDRFRFEACREFFGSNAYETAQAALRVALQNNQAMKPADVVANLEFCDGELNLPPLPFKKKPWGREAPSFLQMQSLKQFLSNKGFFRFGDMDCLARYLLARCPEMIPFLRSRFPVVFIDEMQDTHNSQMELLSIVFGDQCVVQRIGDDRQAIFSDSGQTDGDAEIKAFPGEHVLSMSRSFRVGPRIARLIKSICCCSSPEEIEGNSERKEGQHTVFTFDDTSIQNVLPAFAQLVATEVGMGCPPYDVRAVGAVQKSPAGNAALAHSVRDYWTAFSPAIGSRSYYQSLADLLGHAKWELSTNRNAGGASELIIEAVRRVFRLNNFDEPELDLRRAHFISSLNSLRPEVARRLRATVGRLCLSMSDRRDSLPVGLISELEALLRELMPEKWHPKAEQFWRLNGTDAISSLPPKDHVPMTVFRHEVGAGVVEVSVGTIHSVKGETVKAILVLDTKYHKHHLATLLEHGFLVGQRPKRKITPQLARHVRLGFVAASRPTDLLCFALSREHVGIDQRKALESMGWRVADV